MKKDANSLFILFTFKKVLILFFLSLCLVLGVKVVKKIKHKDEVVIELRDKQGIVLESANETFIEALIEEARRKRRERK